MDTMMNIHLEKKQNIFEFAVVVKKQMSPNIMDRLIHSSDGYAQYSDYETWNVHHDVREPTVMSSQKVYERWFI